MINKTTATLECAAQVNAAASRMSISGSVVTAPSSTRKLGTSSKGMIIESRC